MGEGRVGAVVVHHGDPAPTRRALAALADDPSPIARTVMVVDTGGLDAAAAQRADRVLTATDNPGFGAAANRGVAALGSAPSTLVVLNHDVEIGAGFLAAAAAACRGRVGAAGGPLRRSDGSLWYAGGGVRRLTGTVFQARSESAAVRPREVSFVPGAALAVQPAAWHDVGGFDPWYFLYNEDLDLGLRLRRRGWRLVFEPGMRAVHHLGTATGSADRSPLYLEHLARGRLRPFPSRPYRAYLAVVHTAWVAARAGALVLRHRRRAGPRVRALLRGHGAALAGLVSVPRRRRPT